MIIVVSTNLLDTVQLMFIFFSFSPMKRKKLVMKKPIQTHKMIGIF